jgi:hypothetical protein
MEEGVMEVMLCGITPSVQSACLLLPVKAVLTGTIHYQEESMYACAGRTPET